MPTNASLYTDNNLKKLYDATVVFTINNRPSFLQKILAYGDQDYKYTGRHLEVNVQFGGGGGGGFATAAGDVSKIGTARSRSELLTLPYSYYIIRSQQDIQRIMQWEEGREEGLYIDQAQWELQLATVNAMNALEALMLKDIGDGRMAVVTATTAAIGVDADGLVTVDENEYIVDGQVLQVLRSGSIVADTLLRVVRHPKGSGEATITVTNVGSVSYTPTEDDVLMIIGSFGKNFNNSLNEQISEGPFPVSREGVVPPLQTIDDPMFDSYVVSAGGNAINYARLRAFLAEFQERLPADANLTKEDPKTQQMTIPNAFLARRNIVDALAQDSATRLRFNDTLTSKDIGWGTSLTVDGYPISTHELAPKDTVYFLYTQGWVGDIRPPKLMSIPQYMGAYQRKFGTDGTDMEAVWQLNYAFWCKQRPRNAKLANVTGLDNAGLIVAG